MLGELPHRSLKDLSDAYGPILSLRFGSVPAVVVSSPDIAEHFLKTHDLLVPHGKYYMQNAHGKYVYFFEVSRAKGIF